MRLTTATNNYIIINLKTFLKLIFWIIQLLISPYVLEGGVASDFSLSQIRSWKLWFCLLHHCRENLLRLVYWEIMTISPLLRIIHKIIQCQLSILELSIGNHLLKILIMVLKIIFSLLLTPNALGVNTSGDPIAEVSGTISVVNYGVPVLVLFPSLFRGLSIIEILRNWHLYYLGLGFNLHHLEVFYQ